MVKMMLSKIFFFMVLVNLIMICQATQPASDIFSQTVMVQFKNNLPMQLIEKNANKKILLYRWVNV